MVPYFFALVLPVTGLNYGVLDSQCPDIYHIKRLILFFDDFFFPWFRELVARVSRGARIVWLAWVPDDSLALVS